jgi:hypothetical protein
MVMTERQIKEFEEVSRPLIKFLNDNFHPHVTALLTPASAEIVQGIYHVPIEDYIKD